MDTGTCEVIFLVGIIPVGVKLIMRFIISLSLGRLRFPSTTSLAHMLQLRGWGNSGVISLTSFDASACSSSETCTWDNFSGPPPCGASSQRNTVGSAAWVEQWSPFDINVIIYEAFCQGGCDFPLRGYIRWTTSMKRRIMSGIADIRLTQIIAVHSFADAVLSPH